MALPKKYRLKKRKDFERVLKKGMYYSGLCMSIKLKRNNLNISRFGIVIGSKISKKAVVRNKIKRRISEVIRLNLPQLKKGFDVIVLTKPEIVDKKYQEIENILISLFKKAKIYK
ncbi:ribonuclease P protein component [bacterium]|nr:ribonuclease P protein component [bacterium]